MLVRIDPSAQEPIYAQIVRAVRLSIARGDVREGERLPTARELAKSLDVNMHTVLRAYSELRDAGEIELRRGRGAVVLAQAQVHRDVIQAVDKLLDAGRRHNVSVDELHALIDERGTR